MPRSRRSTWVIAGIVLLAAVVLGPIALAVIGFEIGVAGFVAGFLMAAVPVPFYVAFALWIDRFEPEPSWLLALAFVWGAAISVFFALVGNAIGQGVLTAMAGAASASTLTAVLAAPFVEEIAKGAALFLLVVWKRSGFDNVTDGIVYATMVGLGFAMTENVQYYGRAVAAEGGPGAMTVFFLRGLMGPFSHPLFTSLTGIGLGAARESDDRLVKWLAPPAGLAMAMLLHSLWNLSASFGVMFFATYLLVMIPAFCIVIVIAVYSLRREANIIRSHLESVVAAGVLSRDDVLVVTSASKRFGASTRALLEHGFGAWIARRKFHALATELAFHSWRATRDAENAEQEEHARLVGEIQAVRAKLGLALDFAPPEPELVARLTREIPLPVVTDPAPGARLVCTSGPLAGTSYVIGYTGVQIGRDPAAAEIVVRDPQVSRRHVWIGHGTEGIVAVDHGSTNGTWLNGERIREALLRPGDRLEISNSVATFELQHS